MEDTFKFVVDLKDRSREMQIQLELEPAEFEAIGRITTQWAFFEYHMVQFCQFVASDVLNEPLHKDFESDSFRKKRRAWEELVKRAFPFGSDERTRMDALIQKSGALQGQRQAAVHSFFRFDRKSPDDLKAHSHKNPGGRPRRFNVVSLNRIAVQIAKLNARLIAYPNDYPEIVPAGASRRKYQILTAQDHLRDGAPHPLASLVAKLDQQ